MGWFNAGSKESNSSSSTTTTVTENFDNRMVNDGGSVGINSTGSNINVLDNGAVHQAFGFGYNALQTVNNSLSMAADVTSNAIAGMGITSNTALMEMSRSANSLADHASSMLTTQANAQSNDFQSILGATLALSQASYGAMNSNLSLARDLNQASESAYAGAASQASGTKNIVMAGMVVIGIAAVFAFWKH